MARYQRTSSKEEKAEARRVHKETAQQPSYDQAMTAGEGVFDFSAIPSLERDAVVLAGAGSDEQRHRIAMHLQRSYGNSYVQRVVDRIQLAPGVPAVQMVGETETEAVTASTEAPAATPAATTGAAPGTAASGEGPLLTPAQANLWQTLVVTPLQEVMTQATAERPDWQPMTDTLNTVHQSMESFAEAVSLSGQARSDVENITRSVFDCYMMAHSHATGGAIFGMNLRVALDWANRLVGGAAPSAETSAVEAAGG